ncbi:hypothetical protein Bbelb_046040 [Branchiostoma belcheri]|nr:hypothetical protein Bbelb_046040 [Branchiostoma belcheri]
MATGSGVSSWRFQQNRVFICHHLAWGYELQTPYVPMHAALSPTVVTLAVIGLITRRPQASPSTGLQEERSRPAASITQLENISKPHGDYITTHGDYIITRTEAWRTPSCIKLTKGYATS